MSFLDPDMLNATATFYTATQGGTSDPYEDPDGDWEAVHEDVEVFWDPQGATFQSAETGDLIQRNDRLYAPLTVADDHSKGDRVDVHHRGRVHRLRIAQAADRTMPGDDGYWQLSLIDAGD